MIRIVGGNNILLGEQVQEVLGNLVQRYPWGADGDCNHGRPAVLDAADAGGGARFVRPVVPGQRVYDLIRSRLTGR